MATEYVFQIFYDPSSGGARFQLTGPIPPQVLISTLELAKALYVSQQLGQLLAQQQKSGLVLPDGSPAPVL